MQYDPLYKRLFIVELAMLSLLLLSMPIVYLIQSNLNYFWKILFCYFLGVFVWYGLSFFIKGIFSDKEKLYNFPISDRFSDWHVSGIDGGVPIIGELIVIIFLPVLLIVLRILPMGITWLYRRFVPLHPRASFIPFVIKQKRLQSS
ncbi:hypothetical protein [Acinetobacter sp. HY1485]|uniref:hypothetical protein n=1 Tax=Acinetobacter sp. HY1485 TaxID=2970918 RepID=UPI0022B94977|nr:hypothetical protein [Acinetobacter sp. HY1485]